MAVPFFVLDLRGSIRNAISCWVARADDIRPYKEYAFLSKK